MKKQICRLKIKDSLAKPIINSIMFGQKSFAQRNIDNLLKAKERYISEFSIRNDLAGISLKIEVTQSEIFCEFIGEAPSIDLDEDKINDFIETMSPEFENTKVSKEERGPLWLRVSDRSMKNYYNSNYGFFLELGEFYATHLDKNDYLDTLESYLSTI